jgi:hypothetical protein
MTKDKMTSKSETVKNQKNAKAAHYYRCAKKEDDAKIEKVKAEILQCAADRNIDATVYIDNGASGMNFDRPEFKRMCKDIDAGKISTVYIGSISHFGRNHTETSRWIRTFAAKGVPVISTDGFDNSKVLVALEEAAERLSAERAKRKHLQKWAVCQICHKKMYCGNGCKMPIVYVNGKRYSRIKAGDKRDFIPNMIKGDFCHDCNAGVGQYHHFNCDAERCPLCHHQLISCDCAVKFEKMERTAKNEKSS